jgi:N-acetylmuramoyl-L-alanine amidase
MNKWIQQLLLLMCCVMALGAQAAELVGARTGNYEGKTRLVVEFSSNTEFRVSEETSPGRLVVTVPNTTTRLSARDFPSQVGPVQRMSLDGSGSRSKLIVELNEEAEAAIFMLPVNAQGMYRLVIDLGVVASGQIATAAASPAPSSVFGGLFAGKKNGRDIIVSIDAGHGGQDPGAIGRRGTYEKHVTLAIARSLADYLGKQKGITARLTRDSDFFIPLQQRRKIARYEHKADIFISVHADSAANRSANGASVFALSLQGAKGATSRFAQQLAEQENKSDLIGGVVAENDDLTDMLAGMMVEGTLKHSLEMGKLILQSLPNVVNRLHSKRVEQAGFAVLKEPGMVSLLVETGFISNADEEDRLISASYQRDVAQAIGAAVVRFCQQFPVPGTWFDRD